MDRQKILDDVLREFGEGEFSNLLFTIDVAIAKEIDRDSTGAMRNMFTYFDSRPVSKPLTPREFIQFWGSLDAFEQGEYMLQFI